VTQVQKVVSLAPEPVPNMLSQAMCSTPLHQEAQTDVSSPAWDPNSSTPFHEQDQDQTDAPLMSTSRGHWLEPLAGIRVKLIELAAPNNILEFEAMMLRYETGCARDLSPWTTFALFLQHNLTTLSLLKWGKPVEQC